MAESARNARREDTRKRIIDAAVEVFAERGFYGTRVSDLADAAGVADGTIYLYFKSKDEILISLFREKMAEIVIRLVRLLSASDDPTTKLRLYIAGHLELVAEQPRLMQVLTVELRQSARFMKAYAHHQRFARFLAVIAGIIEEGQRSGAFRSDVQAATVARALFGALDEISLSWVLGGPAEKSPLDRQAVAAQLGEFFLRGLRRES